MIQRGWIRDGVAVEISRVCKTWRETWSEFAKSRGNIAVEFTTRRKVVRRCSARLTVNIKVPARLYESK